MDSNTENNVEKNMESNMDGNTEDNVEKNMENCNNGNVRKGKSVSFNKETQVFVFESPSNEDGESNQIKSPLRNREQGSVRDRVRRYDQNVAWRSIPLRPRPPALPPRNPVQVNLPGPKPLPPKPLPRAKNESSVVTSVRQKVRIFRRPDVRPMTEGREAALLVPHHRMKVPDTPPPPPPSLVSLVPSAAAAKFVPSTPSTSSTPSGPAVGDVNDDGIRLADDQRYNARDEATTAADVDDDNDRKDTPGCFTGCFLFIVSCFSCFT